MAAASPRDAPSINLVDGAPATPYDAPPSRAPEESTLARWPTAGDSGLSPQSSGATRLIVPEPEPVPPGLPEDMHYLWEVWQQEKRGGRGWLERSRGARIIEGAAPERAEPMPVEGSASESGLASAPAARPSRGGGPCPAGRLHPARESDADIAAGDRRGVRRVADSKDVAGTRRGYVRTDDAERRRGAPSAESGETGSACAAIGPGQPEPADAEFRNLTGF